MRSALLIDGPLLAEPSPAAVAYLKRMNGADVAVVALGPIEAPALAERGVRIDYVTEREGWKPKELLGTLRAVAADPTKSWVVCSDSSAIGAASTAGMAGVVLVGRDAPSGDHGLVVASARDLAGVPRVLIPRDGGCWHDGPDDARRTTHDARP